MARAGRELEGNHQERGLWALFARAKYAAAAKGEREPGKRPEALHEAAKQLFAGSIG